VQLPGGVGGGATLEGEGAGGQRHAGGVAGGQPPHGGAGGAGGEGGAAAPCRQLPPQPLHLAQPHDLRTPLLRRHVPRAGVGTAHGAGTVEGPRPAAVDCPVALQDRGHERAHHGCLFVVKTIGGK